MKKVFAVGLAPEEQEKLGAFCQENQWDIAAIPHIGRPLGDYPVQKVLRMVKSGSKVAAVAEETGIDRRHVYRILKNEQKNDSIS